MRTSWTAIAICCGLAAFGCTASGGADESGDAARDATDPGPADSGSWDWDAADPTDDGVFREDDSGVDGGTGMEDASDPDGGGGAVERNYRILHWNIAGGKENDCQTEGITRAVRRYVRDNAVDFVGLNECCPSQFAAITEALRAEWALGATAAVGAYVGDGGSGRVVGNAIFSRFRLQNVTRQQLGTDMYGTRNLICGQAGDLSHLRFCSTHLTPGDVVARTQAVKALDQIEQWWTNRGDTVILSGDLNLHSNDPGLNRFYSAAANTPNNPDNTGRYRELDDADPKHCIGYGEGSQPAGTGGPCMLGGKIDHIFVRENRILANDYAGDTFTIPNDCTGACSDHRAVFGRARVRVLPD